MPSEYESFGQTAVEAMACGIPVIGSQGTGLEYTIGDGGVCLPFNKTQLWADKIQELLTNHDYYNKLSANARARAIKLDPQNDLNALNTFLKTQVKPYVT